MTIGFFEHAFLMPLITFLTISLAIAAVFHEYRRAKKIKKQRGNRNYPYKKVSKVAFLIASKDGEKTIARTVKAALANKFPVYVVSDGSKDNTVIEALDAGGQVMWLKLNVGKASALHKAYKHFKLGQKYDAIAILDDDVLIEKDFIRQAKKTLDRETAIAVGKNLTYWPDNKRWNIWLASRAHGYWAYQITLRTIQSGYNVMTCISGSNSLYRTEVLEQVLTGETKYITEDTYWTLETHRLQLGRITYSPKARAWLQDPTNFRDWYKQSLRWMWGTFQCIIAHRIGSKANKLHVSYLALMVDWALYILSGPLTLFIILQAGVRNLPLSLLLLSLGYFVWVLAAAIALKIPRLILFVPAIIVIDFAFRVVMVHGLIKALRQPTVESPIWSSPQRVETRKVVEAYAK
ncbi:MAG: glycosyltransferase family 2 protein [Candidatus Saccharimonadales bacterium]